MVVVNPLVLLRGALEKVKRGKCEAAGGLSFLDINGRDMSHGMEPYTLMLWEPRRRRPFIMKTLQFPVV
jgi:hypothetical protein